MSPPPRSPTWHRSRVLSGSVWPAWAVKAVGDLRPAAGLNKSGNARASSGGERRLALAPPDCFRAAAPLGSHGTNLGEVRARRRLVCRASESLPLRWAAGVGRDRASGSAKSNDETGLRGGGFAPMLRPPDRPAAHLASSALAPSPSRRTGRRAGECACALLQSAEQTPMATGAGEAPVKLLPRPGSSTLARSHDGRQICTRRACLFAITPRFLPASWRRAEDFRPPRQPGGFVRACGGRSFWKCCKCARRRRLMNWARGDFA